MSLLLKHYSLNRHETVRGWKEHQHAHPCLKIRVGGKLLPIEEDKREPKCAIMKISLVVARESKRLAQPHTSCLGGGRKWIETMDGLYESLTHNNITRQWAVLGSHWVLHCALQTSSSLGMSSYCHFLKPGCGFLDQAATGGPFSSCERRKPSFWGLQGTRHLALVDRESVELMESNKTTPSPGLIHWSACQHADNPPHAQNWTFRPPPPWRNSLSFSRSKSSYSLSVSTNWVQNMQVLCPLPTLVPSSGSCFPASQSANERIYFPSPPPCPFPVSSQCKSSTFNTCSYQQFRDHSWSFLSGPRYPTTTWG